MTKSEVQFATKLAVKKPSLYQVVMLNDDFTPMDFVVVMLKKYFDKSATEATEVMLTIHRMGQAVCGIYPFDVAETKAMQVHRDAERDQYPLRCVLNKM